MNKISREQVTSTILISGAVSVFFNIFQLIPIINLFTICIYIFMPIIVGIYSYYIVNKMKVKKSELSDGILIGTVIAIIMGAVNAVISLIVGTGVSTCLIFVLNVPNSINGVPLNSLFPTYILSLVTAIFIQLIIVIIFAISGAIGGVIAASQSKE